MSELESPEKIAKDIAKLERNLNQVAHITFEGKEKEVYDRAIDYWNDSKYYLEKEDISKSKFYAQQAFNEVRYMIGTTHLNLNESFEEIVKKLAATLEANYNISTKVYIGSTKIQHLSENFQIELIRILQEALSNISRHANASNVEIRFVDGIDDFKFIIKDDGKGFSEEEVTEKNSKGGRQHYGVSNIKERVELLGGTVDFIHEGGTTIAITIKDSVCR